MAMPVRVSKYEQNKNTKTMKHAHIMTNLTLCDHY